MNPLHGSIRENAQRPKRLSNIAGKVDKYADAHQGENNGEHHRELGHGISDFSLHGDRKEVGEDEEPKSCLDDTVPKDIDDDTRRQLSY